MSVDLRKSTVSPRVNLVVYKVKKEKDGQFRELLANGSYGWHDRSDRGDCFS